MHSEEIILNIIINPMVFYPKILDIEFPDEDLPYATHLNEFFNEFISDVCQDDEIIEHGRELINSIDVDIDDLDIEELVYHELIPIQTEIYEKLKERQPQLVSQYYEDFSGLNISYKKIRKEINNKNRDKYAEILYKLIMNIVVVMSTNEVRQKKRKNKNKSYFETDSKLVDEVQYEVNKFDEIFGVNLSEPNDELINDSKGFQKYLNYMKILIGRLILEINDIPEERYIKKIGTRKVKFRKDNIDINKKFKNISTVFTSDTDPINSISFKKRFITYLYAWISDNLEEVADIRLTINGYTKLHGYEEKKESVDELSTILINLGTKLLSNKDYSSELRILSDTMMYAVLENNEKIIDKTEDKLFSLMEHLDNLRLSIGKSNKCVSMDTVLKLSYMISVNDIKCNILKKIKPKKEFNAMTIKSSLRELSRILKKDKHGFTIMYQIFLRSKPKIISKYYGEDTRLGIISMAYLKFYSADNKLSKFIDILT